MRNESDRREVNSRQREGNPDGGALAQSSRQSEQRCRDPKDGELCLGRVKPGETLVEARRDTDVQIVRWTWV